MTYADAYRLRELLGGVLTDIYRNGTALDDELMADLHEAHGVATRACAVVAREFVAGTAPAPAVVATDKPRRGAKPKRPPVIQDDPCPRCKLTGQAFYVRASGQRTAYCVECSKSVPPGSNVAK